MIVIEDLGTRERRYSDEDYYILQVETGHKYEDAVDIKPCKYTYEETDEKIEHEDEDATPEDYEEALREVGVEI